MKQDLLVIAEVAKRLGVSRAWAYQLLKSGNLPYTQIGGHYLVRPDDVARLDRERKSTLPGKRLPRKRLPLRNDEGGITNYMQGQAYSAVQQAILNGELQRPETCSDCGQGGRIEGHHDDYDRLLEVRWLCRKCHIRWHKEHPEVVREHVLRRMNEWA